jgi:hypothetical protein
MPKCVTCGSRYQLSVYNDTDKCDSCMSLDDEDLSDIDHLVNPSGKTQPIFYDDLNDDSHGF